MLPRTLSAIPILTPKSRTTTPTKRSSTPPSNASSPNTLSSLGANAPVFVPRLSRAPEPDAETSQPVKPQPTTDDDPFAASYHAQHEPTAYAPCYAPLLPPYGLGPLDFYNYHSSTRGAAPRPYFMTPALRDELQRKQPAIH
ncbi:hypothetical protein BDV93DRAFT_561002 [Ceratobasidium sp. AG-I]|nr:hypothetical protein BDV93DRAFT_561002 [Ceratobasidium sp. AG-I]